MVANEGKCNKRYSCTKYVQGVAIRARKSWVGGVIVRIELVEIFF